MMGRSRAWMRTLWLAAFAVGLRPSIVAADQAAPSAGAPSDATWHTAITNLARVESWRFFEPNPGGGDPRYTFLGDRFRVDLRGRWPRAEIDLAAQYVGFVGLPDNATGPGPLGTGALYYEQSGRHTNPQQLYLRYANVRVADVLDGVDVRIGRQAYTSGAEMPSGVPKIETVKRQRLDARLVGEFEWSVVQRGFDGVRVDVTRPAWRLTGLAFMPTQGGFAAVAGPTITDVIVGGATVSSRSSGPPPRRTQVQAFGLAYRDRRPVTQRPDNSGQTASAVDIGMFTLGGVVVGAYPAGPGEIDVFGWGSWQTGDWYAERHRAWAAAAEGGYQWPGVPWRPWLRGGWFRASGDEAAGDDRHGTFFPMLPTIRRFAQTASYSTMNLNDAFVTVQARPRPSLGLRLDARRLDLASAADLWYTGSGATLDSGGTFGYAGRRSNGSTRLGTVIEGSADYAFSPTLSVNGFLGRFDGGPVVRGTFAGHSLWFAYVESVISLTAF